MALTTVRTYQELEGFFVLAPERYDPRRDSLRSVVGPARSIPLRKLVRTERTTVQAGDSRSERCLVLDTSDAQEGIIVNRKLPRCFKDLGSAKKVIQAGDVIISRLRPYLRQVAFADPGICHWAAGVWLLCSTEFFVLRAVDGQPIAFLVPFLLSDAVQEVLAASQEGGHHPRFNEGMLLGLPVPTSWVERRDAISQMVQQSILLFRQSEKTMTELVTDAERSFKN